MTFLFQLEKREINGKLGFLFFSPFLKKNLLDQLLSFIFFSASLFSFLIRWCFSVEWKMQTISSREKDDHSFFYPTFLHY